MRLASTIAVCVAASLLSLQARGQEPSPVPQPPPTSQATTPIGMGPTRMTVAEILAALRAQPDVSFEEKDGQLTAYQQSTATRYVFAAQGSAPYPAVAMTHVFVVGTSVKLGLNVICQAATAPCDQFARDSAAAMQQLTKQLRTVAAQQPGYIGHH